ncbi:hypothetical protein SAMN05443428_1304 [Caloramator quimbayensis]|uniref:Uncharacterized protein n=1 Tax=Caloramator quimbayensis TaxID=1147123 RepID=A0A1T4Y9T8_9CLOT|nr:hypothetical protein [Caloramator quimbayensis]SKA98572.1 hypothetical protein SAMN05443428_1304 [Caloramator quimbayensis]
MSIEKNITQTNKEQLLRGLPIFHSEESAALTYNLLINDYGEPFKKCSMYSELKDSNDIGSLYSIVEFNQGVQFEDITDNSFLIRELLCFGIRYLAFFGGGRDYIVNAIACSDYNVLDELIHHKNYKITDVPVEYPVKIHDLQDLQELLHEKLA